MTALLVDTYSLFFRAYHALPPMNAADGTPTHALYGVSALLLKLLREQAPRGLAFALDAPAQTERARAFSAYKQNRPATPHDASAQLPLLRELIAALGVPAFSAPGHEADDVLATLARILGERGERVLVVSGDRDLLQLASPSTAILFVGRRGGPPQLYDEAAVRARFGVVPAQLPSYVALVGDPSDNLPKVKGIGPRIAAQLVARHGDARALLAALDTNASPSPRIRQTLAEHAEQVLRTEALARLRSDLELGPGPYAAPLTAEAFARLRALFVRLEFRSLLPRLDALHQPG